MAFCGSDQALVTLEDSSSFHYAPSSSVAVNVESSTKASKVYLATTTTINGLFSKHREEESLLCFQIWFEPGILLFGFAFDRSVSVVLFILLSHGLAHVSPDVGAILKSTRPTFSDTLENSRSGILTMSPDVATFGLEPYWFIIFPVVLWVLASIFIALRVYVRVWMIRAPGIDDYVLLAAYVRILHRPTRAASSDRYLIDPLHHKLRHIRRFRPTADQ